MTPEELTSVEQDNEFLSTYEKPLDLPVEEIIPLAIFKGCNLYRLNTQQVTLLQELISKKREQEMKEKGK